MPDYLVTDPATGQRIKMTGPAPPSEALIRLALAKVQPLPSHDRLLTQKQGPEQPTNAFGQTLPLSPEQDYPGKAIQSILGFLGLGNDDARANRFGQLLSAGVPILGALKKIGVGEEAAARAIQAYHGSPHDFERFDLAKIGTGEGAQAYGHGLYFAENPAVAEEYKRALGKVVPAFGDEPVKTSAESMAHDILSQLPRQAKDIRQNIYGDKKFYLVDKMSGEWGTHPFETAQEAQAATMTHNTVDAALRAVDQRAQQGVFKGKNEAQAIADVKQAIRDNFGKEAKTAIQGKTYHVSIKADPDQFLDWDKPLSQQPEIIKRMDAAGIKTQLPLDWPNPPRGEHAVVAARDIAGNEKDAALLLKQAGIPGIKYLDQGSRGQYSQATQGMISQFGSREKALAGMEARLALNADPERANILRGMIDELRNPPTSNYVVFDDKLIDILKKYAVAGAVGGSLASLGQPSAEEQK